MLVHFTAGLGLGLLACYVAMIVREGRYRGRIAPIVWTVLSVGVLWEVFEFLFLHRIYKVSLANSASDVLFDLLGGLASAGLWYFFAGLENKNNDNGIINQEN